MFGSIYSTVVQMIFWLIFFVLFSRFAFQLMRAPFVNQIAQWVYTTTNPVIGPIEKVIPRWRNVSVVALLLLWVAAWFELLMLTGAKALSGAGVLVALSRAIDFGLWYFIVAIFIYIVLSWLFSVVETRRSNDMVDLVYLIAVPPIRAVKKRIPTSIGPFDFAPIVVTLALWIASEAQRAVVATILASTLGPPAA